MPSPDFTRLTASTLNSAVYSCLGTMNIPTLPFRYPIGRPMEDEISGEAHAHILHDTNI